jgi:hypothetical protein
VLALIGGILFFPVTAPAWAFRVCLERIRDEAEASLRDEGRAFAELIELSMRHNSEQLSDAEFAEQEAMLLERLSSIRDYREDLLRGELDELEDDWIDDESIEEGDEWFDAEPENELQAVVAAAEQDVIAQGG